MNITKLNDIFTTRGSAAALESAKAAMMAGWIIDLLEDGRWDPNRKPAPKAVEVRSKIDRNGDKSLFAVKVAGKLVRLEVETTGESGEAVVEVLETRIVAEGRTAIGKVIDHPIPENAGIKTNDPKVSQSMKGSSTGGGGKKGK